MLKLSRFLSKVHLKQTQCLRGCASDAYPSVRQQQWQEAQQKYAQYEHILYSSYVEHGKEAAEAERSMSYTKRKYLERQITKATQQGRSVDALLDKLYEVRRLEQQQERIHQPVTFPPNWMDDYEFYEGGMDAAGNMDAAYGSASPDVPPSTVPCNGCGAHLHCANKSLPGFIPVEIFKGRSVEQLKTIICQRCHFLKHYNIALDVEVSPETYVETISRIKDAFALAVVIVDLLDFPCSIWPGVGELLGPKRPIFVVGNKVDLLPRDCNSYLTHIKNSLEQQVRQSAGYEQLNIKHVGLVSAKTGYGIEELITQLHKLWKYKGDVYLIGCTNVGKSSLFNILLNSDYCRPEASDLVRKTTACPWPGTTLQMLRFPIYRPSEMRVYQRAQRLFSERGKRAAEDKLRRDQARSTGSIQAAQLIGSIGRTFDKRTEVNDSFAMVSGTQPIITLNERAKELRLARWCYDTPGVMHPDQITELLTTEELLQLQPQRMMSPRAFRLQPGWSLLLAGLARLDFIGYECQQQQQEQEQKQPTHNWIKALVFGALQLPVVITTTEHASVVYTQYLGTELLGVPCGTPERLARWPGLQCQQQPFVISAAAEELSGDIVLSSAGWIGLSLPAGSVCSFRAWTPHARGIHLRTPALIRHGERLVGRHIKNTLAYHIAKPFVYQK